MKNIIFKWRDDYPQDFYAGKRFKILNIKKEKGKYDTFKMQYLDEIIYNGSIIIKELEIINQQIDLNCLFNNFEVVEKEKEFQFQGESI